MTEAAPQMPDEIYAEATSLDNRGLKNAFGQWIDGSEPSPPFNTRYIRADLSRPHEDAPIADAGGASILAKITRKIGIAGNHLGLCIPVSHPPHTAHSEDVLKQYGAGVTYETWVAWKLVYEAYNELERLVAHTALANNSIPAGWKLVPEEPTEEMLKAAWKDQYKFRGGEDDVSEALAAGRVRDSDQRAQDISAYRAMLAAAPQLREDR